MFQTSFDITDVYGKKGRNIAIKALSDFPGTTSVYAGTMHEDVEEGIDLFWEHSGHILSIDAKIEKRSLTGSLALEEWSNYLRKKGWFRTSKALLIFYTIEELGRSWLFNLLDVRRRFDELNEKPILTHQTKYPQKNDTRFYLMNFNFFETKNNHIIFDVRKYL